MRKSNIFGFNEHFTVFRLVMNKKILCVTATDLAVFISYCALRLQI